MSKNNRSPRISQLDGYISILLKKSYPYNNSRKCAAISNKKRLSEYFFMKGLEGNYNQRNFSN